VVACLLAAGCASRPAEPSLGGTSWQLVRLADGEGAATPDNQGAYSLAFAADGSLTARVDCNRGRGKWKSAGPGRLEIGPMAVTRAYCGPGSLDIRFVRHLMNARAYAVREGRLFLDAGQLELEPAR
jgi:para-nitrobenzyl esterase